MRMIFDLLKNVARKLDGYWIDSAGHPIVIKGYFKARQTDGVYLGNWVDFEAITPTLIYGFYDYPGASQVSMFGIDAPDEMEVEINTESVFYKLGLIIPIGTRMTIEDGEWIVINRRYVYNRFIGKYRLALTCVRYQESVTTGNNGVHVVTEEE